MLKLYDHQQKIVDADPLKCGLWLGTGGGKTITALSLARGKTLVIAPKTQIEDAIWEKDNKVIPDADAKHTLVTISKETFRNGWTKLPRYDTIIIDEAHTVLGVSPTMGWSKRERVPKTSQIFAAVHEYVEKNKPSRIYLCTATIVRNPMCVWAAATLLGQRWNCVQFRDAFYFQLPMPGREVWQARKDDATKARLAKAVQSLGYTGKLDDWFDVPAQTDKLVYIPLSAAQKKRIEQLPLEYPDPIVLVGKTHQVENGVLAGDEYKKPEVFESQKIEKILELSAEFPKLVVFAKYLNQIEAIKNAIQKTGKKVFVLSGATKDRGTLIKEANECRECVFIAQSQVSSGYELPDFPCVVYASMSYSVVDLEQSRGRVLRANALKKNLYIYLVVKGGIDDAVYATVQLKKDFNEAIYARDHFPKVIPKARKK